MKNESKVIKPLTEPEQLKERADYLKYFASKKTYLKFLSSAFYSRASIKNRKGFPSKLWGSIKSNISNNIFNL